MIEMEMNQMKRKVLSLAMIAALCLTMLPTAGWAADAPVEYIDFDENGVQITEPRSCDQYSLVTENNTEWNASDENNGWYVVSGEVTIGKKEAPQRVTVSGDVHLILANDAKLTVNGGISVNAGNSLTVYAQPAENDKTTGSLTVENVEEGNAGIGGDVQQSGDTITINGGEITQVAQALAVGLRLMALAARSRSTAARLRLMVGTMVQGSVVVVLVLAASSQSTVARSLRQVAI